MARLVDEVLPRMPVHQWVLRLSYSLRYLLAWDHGLARVVLGDLGYSPAEVADLRARRII